MRSKWTGRVVGAAALLLVGTGFVQGTSGKEEGDLLLRVGASVRVPAGDSGWAVAVINGDAIVDGTVRDGLFVMNGAARIDGEVGGTVVVVNGRAELGPLARIGKDLVLYQSTVTGATGTSIGGRTIVESGFSFGRGFLIFWWMTWTVALTAAAAVFAGIGGSTLREAMAVLERRTGAALAGAAVTFAGLPLVAGFGFVMVVGLALGVTILAVVLPALWVIGYLVACTWFGGKLRRLLRTEEEPGRPYGAATLGVLGAQLVGLVPMVGGIVVIVAGALGGGALVALGWERWRRAPAGLTAAPPAAMATS